VSGGASGLTGLQRDASSASGSEPGKLPLSVTTPGQTPISLCSHRMGRAWVLLLALAIVEGALGQGPATVANPCTKTKAEKVSKHDFQNFHRTIAQARPSCLAPG
jgi:hypothetical protein